MYHAVKKGIWGAALLLMAGTACAVDIKEFKISRAISNAAPLRTDTADVNGNPFDDRKLLMDSPLSLHLWKNGTAVTDGILPAAEQDAIRLVGFQVENRMFAKCKVEVTGAKEKKIYIDGKEVKTEKNLTPGRHDVVIKVLQQAGKADTLSIRMDSKQEQHIVVNPTGKRMYTLEDYMNGRRAGRTGLSASGRFMTYSLTTTVTGGKTSTTNRILDLQTGNEYLQDGFRQWASEGDRYIKMSTGKNGENIYEYVDVLTGKSTPIYTDYTGTNAYFLPGEKLMLFGKRTEAPKEDPKIYQILEPDDRIAGWRNRNNIQLLDIDSEVVTTLTQGQHNVYASASEDGNRIVLQVAENDVTKRPFSFYTALLLDRQTMKTDTLVRRDGFVNNVKWTPDQQSLVFSGSPEAFGGIGINDSTGKTPSMIQKELFLMDLKTKEVKSLTYDFKPNIEAWEFSHADGKLYALCQNRDRQDIFRLDLKSGKWEQLDLTECFITSFSLSREKPLLSYTGQSDSNSDRIYTVNLKNGKETCILDLNEERMGDVALGKFSEWNFQSSRGDTICGRYYLPPNFDENKKYPMLVYYYGGCSPVGRYLDSYYNYHGWAAMGYVVYVIQPSGCTGFGQEFAARHVNAYGEYTADDIIEGTKKFCEEHPYVNKKKIGCLGASYGGFMTMYLQTVTDIFAAAMAHAGISNPASYWGFGNWGYSYNTICAANSYPWNNAEVMSLRSPLFNADKVHTPILFLHGAIDDNVPVAESVQMFNALKILGRECAMVHVEGQKHHILDYEKRIKWVHTYYAWFAKYLQDDPTWWESMYPTKNLK